MPDQILIAIAAALAGKVTGALYELVKRRFEREPEATAVLEAASGADPASAEVRALADELEQAERTDATFSDELRTAWSELSAGQHVESGGTVNQILGTVSGDVIQARDVHGGINLRGGGAS